MNVCRFQSVDDFYSRAESFLVAREAEHNLTLGICFGIKNSPELYPEYYLAAVEHDGKVIATAVMTPPYRLVLSTSSVPQTAELFAIDLKQVALKVPSVTGPPTLSKAFAMHWTEFTSQTAAPDMSMRIYQLDAVKPAQGVSGAMRRAGQPDRATCIEWANAFGKEAFARPQPGNSEKAVDIFLSSDPANRGLIIWDDGGPVSMAVYTGPTPNGMRVGMVYTPPERRGKGYASANVAALSQMILDTGRRFCFLFTDLNNPTSNHIYQDIGYNPVSDVAEFVFNDPPAGS